jgi:hypothetical protein
MDQTRHRHNAATLREDATSRTAKCDRYVMIARIGYNP